MRLRFGVAPNVDVEQSRPVRPSFNRLMATNASTQSAVCERVARTALVKSAVLSISPSLPVFTDKSDDFRATPDFALGPTADSNHGLA
jgi:hypothetical protein